MHKHARAPGCVHGDINSMGVFVLTPRSPGHATESSPDVYFTVHHRRGMCHHLLILGSVCIPSSVGADVVCEVPNENVRSSQNFEKAGFLHHGARGNALSISTNVNRSITHYSGTALYVKTICAHPCTYRLPVTQKVGSLWCHFHEQESQNEAKPAFVPICRVLATPLSICPHLSERNSISHTVWCLRCTTLSASSHVSHVLLLPWTWCH